MEDNFRILKPYFRGLPLIILAMVIGYLVARKYLNYATPMFESTAKLKLADIGDGVPSSNLFKDLDVFVSLHRINAEIEVLKSEILLQKVVDKLQLKTRIYRKGQIKTVELFDQSPFVITHGKITSKSYDHRYDLVFKDRLHYTFSDPHSGVSFDGIVGDTLKMDQMEVLVQFNDSFLVSNPHIETIDHFQFEFISKAAQIEHLRSHLDITSVDKDVAVIRISYKSAIPQKAAAISNALAEAYIQDYIENKFQAANITVSFLERQIESVFLKLTSAEDNIQNFRDAKRITNLRQETETDLREISQLKIQKTNLEMNLSAIKDLEKYVQEGQEDFLELAPNFEAFTDLLSTEIIKNIKSLQAEKKDLLLVYTEEDEKVQVIDAKIKDLTNYLLESISNTRKNLEVKYAELERDIQEAEKAFIGIPEKERILTQLNREFSIYQESYNFLNKKKIEAEIAQAANISFHRIITKAQIADQPISPNRGIITIVAVILSMFGAIVCIAIIHILKAKVNNRQSIESNSLIPIAMLVPFLDQKNVRVSHFLKEAIQLEIKGLISDHSLLAIHSFDQQEGAQFNTLHLAKALAMQDRKVLIVDIDGILNEEQKASLSMVKHMSLKDSKYDRYTQSMMQDLMQELKVSHDIVLSLSENMLSQKSLLIMKMATTNLVVLDTRKSSFKKIMETDLMVEEYQLPQVNFILNRYAYNPSVIVDIKEFIGFVVQKLQQLKSK
ncbi:hypothetical protein KFE94_07425 [bacterium SCSIO 12643]|nr:hypothetical protein KFE94_07425 [bacterium SCSIO 12643]